ncbi:hypothetical protein HNO88_001573 [Novosphingobium chloroacetimidivorans]|uniref:Uncharacterized protein n=1 Tax=Novosphingobium chloroacetimidivorans TaxID=1428314 RepID=A0A7W7K8K9_9SPHN|nr:hypothetical protein [Novosphingobium chloroacetimidivorans]MBB4858254.1 hypothetical protein [Novosphingobium chloroacetimidivorans]
MTEYYVVYDIETGAEGHRAQGPEGAAMVQTLPEGKAAMIIPFAAFYTSPLDLDIIKVSYAASIDADADKVRSMFITNTPGQMATYLQKEAEARRVLAGDTSDTVFLSAEAAAIGVSVADLAAEVVAQADQWRPLGAAIEAARRKAKVAVANATNLAELAAAAKIDWQEVVAPGSAETASA